MSLPSILLTLACVAMIGGGQLLFKAAAAGWRVEGGAWQAFVSFLSPLMVAALVVYGLATVLWVYVLRTVPLSAAYAMFSLAFVFVPVLAHLVLGEPLEAKTIVGGAIIVLGVVVATR